MPNEGMRGPGVNGRLSIDITQTSSVVCDECGHNTFMQTFIMRLVSAVYSPDGEESLMPIPVFECSSCGHVNDIFLPEGLKSDLKDLGIDPDEES